MKKISILVLCFALFFTACSSKTKRISFQNDTLGELMAERIDENTTVVNKATETFPVQLPIYKISERQITEEEFQTLQQQFGVPDSTASWHRWKLDGNEAIGTFADLDSGIFTMTESELEVLAWDTFNKIPFLEGPYEYLGIKGEHRVTSSEGSVVTSVRVTFCRLLDGVRVTGNDQCVFWFNDDGLVQIEMYLYDYEADGTMDMVPMNDAVNKIKSPDVFNIEGTGIAETLQVDQIKLFLINQHARGCTILQPVYKFYGTATFADKTKSAFNSMVIAIPESYTYEEE